MKFSKQPFWVVVTSVVILSFMSQCDILGHPNHSISIKHEGIGQKAAEHTMVCFPVHTIGKFLFDASSAQQLNGNLEAGYYDCFTGAYPPIGNYPKGSSLFTLGATHCWVGGIVDGDTLVSTDGYGAEFAPLGTYIMRSIRDPKSPLFEGAVSERDVITSSEDYTGTWNQYYHYYTNDYRPHKPLNIEITAHSFAWSYGYAEDFVLIKFQIKNVGNRDITDAFLGWQVHGVVGYAGGRPEIVYDDIGGFRKSHPSSLGCGLIDTLDLVWVADNDGDPFEGQFQNNLFMDVDGAIKKSCTNLAGIAPLEIPIYDRLKPASVAYNWSTVYAVTSGWYGPDIGPQSRAKFRDYHTGGTGEPFGDAARYHMLSNGEIDYDPIYTASIQPYDPIWIYPKQEVAGDISDGFAHFHHHFSIGPYDIPSGGVLTLPFVCVAGENFHTDPNNGQNLPDFPKIYYHKLDFSDIAKNIQWAKWIYDNPGYDTDEDGYVGEYHVCVLDSELIDGMWEITAADTIYYKGDGVPDWRAAGPPPPPDVWVEPQLNGIRVRFNGSRSETEKDIFTRIVDFEGYNVYFGRDDRESSYSLAASFDHHNYEKYVYKEYYGYYEVDDIPFSLDSLRCLYGSGEDPCSDSSFDPLDYRRTFPYQHPQYPESLFYFLQHSYNSSELGVTSPIRKIYPDALDPRGIPADSLSADHYTADGRLKFFEYEYFIENLLSTVPYYVNVTAFDFGSPRSDLRPLESSITLGAKSCFPLNSGDPQVQKQIYIYPNPYRVDANYRDMGFEGRTEDDRPDYRVRAVHFANLPPKCTISIYSLDGDLVKSMEHDFSPADPNYTHHSWDLISRNRELVVSGLYYWVVETPGGETTIGKLAVIL